MTSNDLAQRYQALHEFVEDAQAKLDRNSWGIPDRRHRDRDHRRPQPPIPRQRRLQAACAA